MPSGSIGPGAASRLRSAVAPLLTLAVALAYAGVAASGRVEDELPDGGSVALHAGLVGLQAVALLLRRRRPLAVLAVVVALDLVVLATSEGQLGLGALAVVVAVYGAVPRGPRRTVYPVLAAAAVATAVVSAVAVATSSAGPVEVVLVPGARLVLLYALPAAVAEQVLARRRLRQLVQEREELLERERRDRAERERRDGRTALARELHDIAGHHLSGIIVSAQAASVLTRSDPDRARDTLQGLQDDARTALTDLRRTVGLLRDDDADERAAGARGPNRLPCLDAVPALVEDARGRGQLVELTRRGTPRPLGVLAETAAYRMVQESLANSARHAPGTLCRVSVDFLPDEVRLTVRDAAPEAPRPHGEPDVGDGDGVGYGLAGMAERAALVGARLSTGPQPDGGWCNELTIPSVWRGTP